MSDEHVRKILRYARRGGQLCIVGPAGTHDEWMLPRKRAAFGDIPSAEKLRTAEDDSVVSAVRRLCAGQLSLSVEGPKGLCVELTEQRNRRLIHLVNYRPEEPAGNVRVHMRVPLAKKARSLSLISPFRKGEATVSFEEEDGVVRFEIPLVDAYEIAVLQLDE